MTLESRGLVEVMGAQPWRRVPEGWPAVPSPQLEAFSLTSAAVVTSSRNHLETACSRATPPIAALADTWQISDPLSATDVLLLACSGTPLKYEAVDRLLRSDSWHRTAILRAASELDDGIGLVMAGPVELQSMERLHSMVDAALAGHGLRPSAREEITVFLCSRLRPRLFPPSTCLIRGRGNREGWQLYRAALDHAMVRAALADARVASLRVQLMEDLAILELAASTAAPVL